MSELQILKTNSNKISVFMLLETMTQVVHFLMSVQTISGKK